MKKRDTLFLIGFILIAVGLFMFFKSTSVSSWGFYRMFGSVSTGGIIIALILLDIILYVATQSNITKIMLPILACMLVLSVLLGTRIHFSGSVLDIFLMLVPAAIGTGLIIKALFTKE